MAGLNLINFDPRAIKALNSAIAEYTYLRKKFVPSLPSLSANRKKLMRIKDTEWCITKSTLLAQQNSSPHTCDVLASLPNKGIVNSNGNGYAGSILQCLLNSKAFRNELKKESNENITQLITLYESPDHTPIDASRICNELVSLSINHSPVEFLTLFMRQYPKLNPLIEHCVRSESVCNECMYADTVDDKQLIVNVSFNDLSKNVKMNDLLQNIQNWHANVCRNCSAPCTIRKKILNAGHFLVFQFDAWDPTGTIRRKGNINCVPTAPLKIGTSLYKPKASIHPSKHLV